MNINQALRKLAALKGEFARIENKCKNEEMLSYDTHKEPVYNLQSLLETRSNLSKEIVDLKERIAITNANTKITVNGETLSLVRAIYLLQEQKGFISFFGHLEDMAPHTYLFEVKLNEYVEGKVNTVHQAKKAQITKEACSTIQGVCREEFNALNAAVEAANHNTELI